MLSPYESTRERTKREENNKKTTTTGRKETEQTSDLITEVLITWSERVASGMRYRRTVNESPVRLAALTVTKFEAQAANESTAMASVPVERPHTPKDPVFVALVLRAGRNPPQAPPDADVSMETRFFPKERQCSRI